MSYNPQVQQLMAKEPRPMSQKVADSLGQMFDSGRKIFKEVNYSIYGEQTLRGQITRDSIFLVERDEPILSESSSLVMGEEGRYLVKEAEEPKTRKVIDVCVSLPEGGGLAVTVPLEELLPDEKEANQLLNEDKRRLEIIWQNRDKNDLPRPDMEGRV